MKKYHNLPLFEQGQCSQIRKMLTTFRRERSILKSNLEAYEGTKYKTISLEYQAQVDILSELISGLETQEFHLLAEDEDYS